MPIQPTVSRDLDRLRNFDQFSLLMIEQPLWYDDFYFHAQLQKTIKTSICLDEAIHNARDAEAAIQVGACRIVNVKVGRVAGFSEAIRVHDVCQQRGIPVWCGGMLETGIGRSHNIALSTLPELYASGRRLGFQALLEGRHHRAGGRSLVARYDSSSGNSRSRI